MPGTTHSPRLPHIGTPEKRVFRTACAKSAAVSTVRSRSLGGGSPYSATPCVWTKYQLVSQSRRFDQMNRLPGEILAIRKGCSRTGQSRHRYILHLDPSPSGQMPDGVPAGPVRHASDGGPSHPFCHVIRDRGHGVEIADIRIKVPPNQDPYRYHPRSRAQIHPGFHRGVHTRELRRLPAVRQGSR